MTQVLTTSSTTVGINISAASQGEVIFLTEGITRASTNDYGLFSDLGDSIITVNGALFGRTLGMVLEDADNLAGLYSVTVGTAGSITGSFTGVSLADGRNTVTNHGVISGVRGILNSGSDSEISNFGSITGQGNGGVWSLGDNFQVANTGTITSQGGNAVNSTGDNFQLANTGTITSHGGSGVVSDGARSDIVNYGIIQSLYVAGNVYGVEITGGDTAGSSTLTNYGTISAHETAVSGDFKQKDEVYNLGNINGNVQLREGNDKLINTGNILGDVRLGVGDDKFDGRGGTVIGSVFGDNGTDILFGGNEEDVLHGGDGRDVVRGGVEADELNGGNGSEDWLDYRGSTARVVVNLGTGQADGGDAAGDNFTGFERLIGSNLNDTLTGDSANNVLRGNNGNDFMRGASGNDLIAGNKGSDVLDGGNGIDALDYRTSNAAVTVNLTNDTASGGDAEGDTIRNFESIYGSNFNDRLTGDASSNFLSGQAGNDTFVFSNSLGFANSFGFANVDTINDFNVAADQIELDNAIFTAIVQVDGTMLPGYFKANGSGVAKDANDRIIYDTSSGELYYDADGNGAGAAQQFAKLSGGLALTFNDFDIV